jgi:hypothetical protein
MRYDEPFGRNVPLPEIYRGERNSPNPLEVT